MISSAVPQECDKTIYEFRAPVEDKPAPAPRPRSIIDK
jgi:hypothetical protein